MILTLALPFLVPAPGASATTAGNGHLSGNLVTMLSDSGDFIGLGQPRLFTEENAIISVSGDLAELTVFVEGGTQDDYFNLTFAAAKGEDLHPGFYDDAQRAPFREPGHPGMDINGTARGCNDLTGRFDVKDIATSANGKITRLWLTYEQHCEGIRPALYGEVRIGEHHRGWAVAAPNLLWWPDTARGSAATVVPVWVVNTSGGAVFLGNPTIVGSDPADFTVQLDQCPHGLGSGEFCPIYVGFAPQDVGPRTATLQLETTSATVYAQLDGLGTLGRTILRARSEPGDPVGQGRRYHEVPGHASFSFAGTTTRAEASVAGSDGSRWTLDFMPPAGGVFTRGTKYRTERRPALSPAELTGARMDVRVGGRSCPSATGSFRVTAISVLPGGTLTSFGARFDQSCDGVAAALRGNFEYRIPAGDSTPPGPVSGVEVSRGQDAVTVSWANPPDDDLAFVVVRYLRAATPPGSPNGSFFGYEGTGMSATIAGVPDRFPFAVAIWAVDTSGNVSPPVTAVG